MDSFYAQALVLVSIEHDHARPPPWRTSDQAQDARPTGTAVHACWTSSGDHGIGTAAPARVPALPKRFGGAACWLRENRRAADVDRKLLCQAFAWVIGVKPRGADCFRTEVIRVILPALLGLQPSAFGMLSPPAAHCATGTGTVQLPSARSPPTACIRRRPQKTVTVRHVASVLRAM